jgi:hypothetical protein
MGKKKEEVKEEVKEESLLKELCGDDAKLHDFLSNYLCLDPLAAISRKGLDILTEEGGKSGDFRPAVDKAILEGAQNPGERERYIKIIQTLALKTIHATEQEIEKAEKEGLVDRAATLERRIEQQKFMSERAEDIINIASKFYNERLVELGENERREERKREKQVAEGEEWRTAELEKDARKKERRGMGRGERREAEKQEKRDELAAEEAKGEARIEAEKEEQRIGEMENAEREARKKERRGN